MLYHPEKGKVVLKNAGDLKNKRCFLFTDRSDCSKDNINLRSRLSVDGPLHWSARVSPGSVIVRYVTNSVLLGQFFSRYFDFLCKYHFTNAACESSST